MIVHLSWHTFWFKQLSLAHSQKTPYLPVNDLTLDSKFNRDILSYYCNNSFQLLMLLFPRIDMCFYIFPATAKTKVIPLFFTSHYYINLKFLWPIIAVIDSYMILFTLLHNALSYQCSQNILSHFLSFLFFYLMDIVILIF